jgi:small-conductance mechanosensitive channel
MSQSGFLYSFIPLSTASRRGEATFQHTFRQTSRQRKVVCFSVLESLETAVQQSSLFVDLAVAGVIGTSTTPAFELFYNATRSKYEPRREFRKTFAYGLSESLTQSARTFGAIRLGVAIVQIVDDDLLPKELLGRDEAYKIGLVVLGALISSAAKRSLFASIVTSKDPDKLGRVSLFDKLADFIIVAIFGAFLVDFVGINIGMGLQSLITTSGVGAIFFSLATKNVAEQVVGGLVIRGWDVFAVGDDVKLGDGTEGTVKRIGLIETNILGEDNVVMTIPNSKVFNQKISNLSEVDRSQVKQTLRFRYSDIKRISATLQSMKEEITKACPELITDGSRPFRADLFNYNDDHIEVKVNCHFELKPGSSEYLDARENMLHAIAVAVEKNGVEFALPSINYVVAQRTSDKDDQGQF